MSLQHLGTNVARAASVLSDGVVLILTLMKTYFKTPSPLEVVGSHHHTVRGTLLRDSECYQND